MPTKSAQQRHFTAVVGLGATGYACARFLRSRGVYVAITDSRPQPPCLQKVEAELPEVRLSLGQFDAELLCAASEIVVSPGVSIEEPALAAAAARKIPIISEIELFARYARAPVVAITGSNGKSTVTTIIGLMAEQAGQDVAVGGNIGTPALDLLRSPEPQLYVLELSSFQLETTYSLNARAAVVLNLSADHMDRYRGMEDYAAVKQRIYRGDGVMVINADDPVVNAMTSPGRRSVPFSLQATPVDGVGVEMRDGEQWIIAFGTPFMPLHQLKLPGRHNLANALAAIALGSVVGLAPEAMRKVLREFPGLEHRTEWVASSNGVTWYNDSKGTNVGATLAAVQGLPESLVLIAGGEGKGADFSPLADALAGKARAVVLIGRDASLIENALAGRVPVVHAADVRDAVSKAAELAQAGDSVLLSPACASFDMFSGYEARGAAFKAAVREVLP